MLAKEIKIQTLIYQRDFIENELGTIYGNGNPAYLYPGYLYPENRKFFKEQGYDIITFLGKEASIIRDGETILNLFRPADGILLTTEEICDSEEVAAELKSCPEFTEIWDDTLLFDTK